MIFLLLGCEQDNSLLQLHHKSNIAEAVVMHRASELGFALAAKNNDKVEFAKELIGKAEKISSNTYVKSKVLYITFYFEGEYIYIKYVLIINKLEINDKSVRKNEKTSLSLEKISLDRAEGILVADLIDLISIDLNGNYEEINSEEKSILATPKFLLGG